jgi:Ca2+-binding RTX toxin-like protein
VVAGAGAQTIFGGNSNPTLIVAGSGQDVILAGASTDYVEAGSGSALVFAGANDIFAAINGQAGGELAIVGFNPSNDFIRLQGYASTAVATALAGATIAGGSTQLTLPDATKLVLYGVTNLTAASFI